MRVGYSTWFVCLSVCRSVTALAASASVYAANQQYSRVSLTFLLDFKSYCVKKIFMSSLRAVFGTFPREGQLVDQMLLQRLATGATGVKQAR